MLNSYTLFSELIEFVYLDTLADLASKEINSPSGDNQALSFSPVSHKVMLMHHF